MVVNDLCVLRVPGFPPKTHPMLVIDPDAVLTFPVSFESLKAVPSKFPEDPA